MDFTRLRYLAAVGRTGSVRGAAAALHVSPGTVSKALALLEEEAGTQLIAAAGRGIELTVDGKWLARRAAHLVGEHASLTSDLELRSRRDASMCMASYDVFVEWFPAFLTRQFLPDVTMSVRERYPGEIEEYVATRVSDIGITWTPVPTDGVEHIAAGRAHLGIYTAHNAFPKTAFADLPFAISMHPVQGATTRFGPLDGWPIDGPRRNVRYAASALEARLELARSGQAAVLLPEFVAERHNSVMMARHRLVQRPLPSGLRSLARTASIVQPTNPSELMRTRAAAVLAAVRVAISPPGSKN